MKRLLLFLIALTLIASGCTGARAEGITVYTSDFSNGLDGWYGRGAECSYENGVLHTRGRTSSWNSPGRDFDLIEDGEYKISVQVFQDQLDSAEFMISVAHSVSGLETYENIASAKAGRGEWTAVSGTYKAGSFERFVLYVETKTEAELPFDIKDFTVTAPHGLPEPRPTEPPMIIDAVETIPSLKDIYAGKFDFGSAVPAGAMGDRKLKQLVLDQFNIITPENELKPDSVLDVPTSRKLAQQDETAAAVHFDAAKSLLNFARDNGLKMHGHVLVWHSQTPEAFFHEGYDAKKPFVTREVMLGRLENYIKGVMEYMEKNYPGVIVSWDVVNEAIDDSTNWLRKSNWYKVVGEDFVARAFELARKYAPEGTLLYYNDYNTAMTGKLNGIIRLLNTLIPEGNIDGYGFQMHHSVGFPSMQLIKTAVENIAALGIKLRVSEMDIGVDNRTETSFRKQAEKYGQIMRLLLRCSDQFEAVQVWGLSDRMSWRSASYPLLFDASLNPKPAFWAVADPDSVP